MMVLKSKKKKNILKDLSQIILFTDPEGLARKRSKFEALHLDRVLQPNNLPINTSGNFFYMFSRLNIKSILVGQC